MTSLFSCKWKKNIILKISLEEFAWGGAGIVAVSTSCRIPGSQSSKNQELMTSI